MHPDPSRIILLFFVYSFLGNIMECIVLSLEKRSPVTNRGFVRHLPFCIIYGFGALFGFITLSPLAKTWIPLFLVGAVAATMLEYCAARLQIHLFGNFWWDYSQKPFNYKGILCLESTLGWGVVALVIIKLLHPLLVGLVHRVPAAPAAFLGVLLLLAYTMDFAHSARRAMRSRQRKAAVEDTFQKDI